MRIQIFTWHLPLKARARDQRHRADDSCGSASGENVAPAFDRFRPFGRIANCDGRNVKEAAFLLNRTAVR